MRLRRVRVESLATDDIVLESARAHYVRDVLRLASGTPVELFDGRGASARATLTQVDAEVHVRVDERYPAAAGPELVIAMATPKGDRADWAVEKLTELGVTRIVWLVCERSVVVPREDGKRLARWERIAESAAGQSHRNDVPVIVPPVPFSEAIAELGGGVVAHMDGGPIATVLSERRHLPLTALIGPEGGFTAGELAMAEAAGYSRVGLARHVLRSETAAMAAAVAMGNVVREP